MKTIPLFLVTGLLGLAACRGNAGATATPPPRTTSDATWNPIDTGAKPGHAHRLVIDATACWFGGVWRDAIDETTTATTSTEEQPSAPPPAQCTKVLSEVYGMVD